MVRYVESPQFHERARQYAVAQIERATGGRVELQRLAWNWRRLEFELDGLEIHGTEAAGEAPLLQVERVRARLKLDASCWPGQLVLRELQVLHPLAHVDVYKDGSTNFPGVQARHARGGGPETEELLRLAVDQAELVDGRLDWNQQKIRLDGVASGILRGARATAAADAHYEGKAQVGQVRMQLPQWEPLTLGAEGELPALPRPGGGAAAAGQRGTRLGGGERRGERAGFSGGAICLSRGGRCGRGWRGWCTTANWRAERCS